MGGKYEVGIDPRTPLDYIGTQFSWAPIVRANRRPLTTDTNYPLFCFWRVSLGINNSAPLTGVEGEFWYLAKFDNTNGEADWLLISSGAVSPTIYFDLDTGTTPITANGSGNVDLTGARVATATVGANVIDTDGTASNEATFRIQEAGSNASTADPTKYGVSQFDANQFTVINGFVQLNSGISSWNDVTSATQILAVENGYATDRGGGVTYTLPATATIGNTLQITGKLGISTVSQNAGQQILLGSSSTTVGVTGSIVGTNVGDCITLRCITGGASSIWRAEGSYGNWTIN